MTIRERYEAAVERERQAQQRELDTCDGSDPAGDEEVRMYAGRVLSACDWVLSQTDEWMAENVRYLDSEGRMGTGRLPVAYQKMARGERPEW